MGYVLQCAETAIQSLLSSTKKCRRIFWRQESGERAISTNRARLKEQENRQKYKREDRKEESNENPEVWTWWRVRGWRGG